MHPGLRERYEELMADCGAPKCELLREGFHRARKAHDCHRCARGISPGQSYRAQFWLVDGEATYEKTCSLCLDEEYSWADFFP